ncbi:MAG: hypothetical protein ACYCSO_00525 [Cuniculiplasma sp.]
MNLRNDVYNSVRKKFTLKIIIILSLISILIFPAVLIENASIPTSDSHMFFMAGCKTSTINGTSGNGSFSESYFVLNHNLKPAANVTVRLNTTIELINTINNSICFIQPYINMCTGSDGNFSINSNQISRFIPKSMNPKETVAYTLSVSNYTIYNNSSHPINGQKDNCFRFNQICLCKRLSGGFANSILVAYLPSAELGYYGLAPVFYAPGEAGKSYNLTYYFSSGPKYVCPNLLFMGNASFNHIYSFNKNEASLLALNEKPEYLHLRADRIPVSTAFYSSLTTFQNGISNGGLLFLSGGSEIMLLVVVFMVIILFTPMFNPSVYKRYLSLPRKRSYILINEFLASLIAMSIFEGGAFIATSILSSVIFHYTLSGLAYLYIYLFSIAAFVVFSSLYGILCSYFVGRNLPKTGLTVFLIIGYPIIASIAQALIELSSVAGLPSVLFSRPFNDLFKPILDGVRTYNLMSGLLPVLNVVELNNYLLRNPAPNVIMLNHLSIFDLSPFIFLTSIVLISLGLFYLSIRRLNRY